MLTLPIFAPDALAAADAHRVGHDVRHAAARFALTFDAETPVEPRVARDYRAGLDARGRPVEVLPVARAEL